MPPKMTLVTVPKSRAASPDSNAPSSLLLLTKKLLTACTRPIIFAGVSVYTSVARSTTLTLSKAPLAASSSIDKR